MDAFGACPDRICRGEYSLRLPTVWPTLQLVAGRFGQPQAASLPGVPYRNAWLPVACVSHKVVTRKPHVGGGLGRGSETVGAGVSFYGDAIAAAPLVDEARMGDALQVTVEDAEHVAGPGLLLTATSGVVRVATGMALGVPISLPDYLALREQCGTPRIARLRIAGLPVAPAHEGGTPGISFVQPAVTEVFRHTGAVVTAGGFRHTHLCTVDGTQPCGCAFRSRYFFRSQHFFPYCCHSEGLSNRCRNCRTGTAGGRCISSRTSRHPIADY